MKKPAFKLMLQKFDKKYELPGKTFFSETAVPKRTDLHISDNILEALRHAFEEWSLDEKKLGCINNRASIIAAVNRLNWLWLSCSGHKHNGMHYRLHSLSNGSVPHLGQFVLSELVEGIWRKPNWSSKSSFMASYW
ncbi:hypothetical protein MHYP_G00359840 [Metynnis hypsauchen]